jgi:hypothetical protein
MKLRLDLSTLDSTGFVGGVWGTVGIEEAAGGTATPGLASGVPTEGLDVPTGVPTVGLGVPTGVPTVGLGVAMGVPTGFETTGVEVGRET